MLPVLPGEITNMEKVHTLVHDPSELGFLSQLAHELLTENTQRQRSSW
jgi:hypothetical protein